MAESKSRRKPTKGATPGAANDEAWLADVQQLSYQDARTALELAMAQLQSTDLEVEQMASLYRRAEAYANRCEAVLAEVQQEVIEWAT